MQGTIKNRHGHDLHLAERTVPVFVFLLPLRTPQGQNLSKDQFFLQIMPLYDKDHRIADLELRILMLVGVVTKAHSFIRQVTEHT